MPPKKVILRENPDPLDDSWIFNNVNIPVASAKENRGKIVSFKTTGITLDAILFPKNRILHGDNPSKFVLASFSEFRFPDQPRYVVRDYMIRFFASGLYLNRVHYRFYGHSNSQLRSRTCFLREARNDQENEARISKLGEFDKIMNASKKAKRIGLLFSEAPIDWILEPQYTKDIPDITKNGELFSDGCGLISRYLTKMLARKKKIRFHGRNYTPCVYQIRYKGYKGVVMLHPELNRTREGMIAFRASQKKFTATGDNIFSVVDYSVPYAYGRLNDDILVLLASLGVANEKLIAKQQAYFDWITNACTEWEAAFEFLSSLRNHDLAERVLLEGLDTPKIQSEVQALQNSEIASFKKQDTDQYKTRMIIHKSRLLFGVCDPYQVLKEGEVHIRISVPRKGETTLVNIDVLVVRNPCLHPGDCLKLRAIAHPKLAHLVDCVVFATVGRKAAPAMSSGGDLDGDKFFVMWDPDIMPPKRAESYTYPEGRAPPPRKVTQEDLAKHFASYNTADLGRVSNLHRKWVYASPQGAMSPQCQELNALHSLAVDGGKIAIPDRLKNPPKCDEENYILNVLAKNAREYSERFLQARKEALRNVKSADAHEIVSQFLSTTHEHLTVTEFEMVTLAFKVARRNGLDPRNYLLHVDFSALTTPQKYALSVQLGLTPEEDPYVWNSLIRSEIIQPRELQDRNLHGPIRLQRLYASTIQGRAAFFEYLQQAMEEYTRKLIVLKTDERFSVGIFIKGQLDRNEDVVINDNVAVCSFMAKAGGPPTTYRRGTKGYKIHCNDNTFEVFNNQRVDTFIFVTRPAEKSGWDIVTSIALEKISKNVRLQLGRLNRAAVIGLEIHVISNRDRIAHQAFDLRFEHVDTEEYLHRFDQKPVPYTPNSLRDINWSDYPSTQGLIFSTSSKDDAKVIMQQLDSKTLESYMEFALERRAEDQLFWLFEHLLERDPTNHPLIASHLFNHPALAYVVLKRYLRDDTTSLPPEVSGLGWILLRDIIRSANSLNMATLVALEKLSTEIQHLDFRSYADLLWLATHSIRPFQLVQEVLMVLHECRQAAGKGGIIEYAHKHALAIAFDRAEEAADECPTDENGRPKKQKSAPIRTKLLYPQTHLENAGGNAPTQENVTQGPRSHVIAHVRVDAPSSVRIHSHVRLQVASRADHSTLERAVVDAVVIQASRGELRLDVMQPLLPEFQSIDWNMYPAGSIATARAMMDAVLRLVEETEDCCRFYRLITSTEATAQSDRSLPLIDVNNEGMPATSLNSSQLFALKSAGDGLTLIWGPPGTGKTTVIVQILLKYLRETPSDDESPNRILMTASTHNAVDNVLERFLEENEKMALLNAEQVLRVATDPSKVAKAHQRYTIDARVGGSITENPRLMQQAEKRFKEARIVFTTCAGAGLGITRKYDFPTVLIDEASQITEPCALIPLVKGCQRAVLVGDHVQLRPTVKPMGKVLQYDVSLMERLYTGPPHLNMSRAMLEIQYRFSDAIGRFPSTEFYEGRLRSGLESAGSDLKLDAFPFPWPVKDGRLVQNVFVPCSSEEDYGRSSKSNSGQVKFKHIILLLKRHKPRDQETELPSIAVLSPYSRRVAALRSELESDITISTIDGFQDRESDVVIFSTVRCNAEGDIGIIEDPRKLNVAWTRYRLALILIGDRRTLEKNLLWQRALKDCTEVKVTPPVESL